MMTPAPTAAHYADDAGDGYSNHKGAARVAPTPRQPARPSSSGSGGSVLRRSVGAPRRVSVAAAPPSHWTPQPAGAHPVSAATDAPASLAALHCHSAAAAASFGTAKAGGAATASSTRSSAFPGRTSGIGRPPRRVSSAMPPPQQPAWQGHDDAPAGGGSGAPAAACPSSVRGLLVAILAAGGDACCLAHRMLCDSAIPL